MRYGVIFDMDGVLVDSAQPHLESWQQLAHEIGREFTDRQFWETFGRQNRDIIPYAFGVNEPARIEQLGERKEVIYRDIIREHVPAVSGAVELVRSCHEAGFVLAIGSSGPPENVDVVLDGMGISPLFSARITAREAKRGKPDPQVFILAAEALGLPPRQCAVIEDAPAGVRAAKAAGAAVVALAGGHPAETLAEADLVVRSFAEVTPARIRQLIERRAS